MPKATLFLRFGALAYLGLLLLVPVTLVVTETFAKGIGPAWAALSSPTAIHAFQLTAIVAVLAVVLNALFGVMAAILIVRHKFPGRRLFDALVDLPIAVSPVVVGLALILVYGRFGYAGTWLEEHGIQIIFSLPGMVLATAFVTLPLVVRELVPVLREIGIEQEQAAWTLGAGTFQTFWRITLPAIRWALAYGVILTLARALGEYGAVAVVSGRIVDKTQTVTLLVEQRFQNFNQTGAYAASFALALVAVLSLLVMELLRTRRRAA